MIGGHEIQLLEICKSINKQASIEFWVSNEEQLRLIQNEFASSQINIDHRITFVSGNIFSQFWRGLIHRNRLVYTFHSYDAIIVSAGTPEAGITAFYKIRNLNNKIYFYFPALVQRSLIWGKIGIFYDIILFIFLRQLKNIITISNIQKKVFAKLASAYTRIHVVSNRVRIDISPSLFRERRLLYLGRLDKQKRINEIIKWGDHPSNPIQELLIFGEGPSKGDLLRQAQRCERLKVDFLGWLELKQIEKLISSNDILVLNSTFEGDPLVIREMQKAGINVIARDIRGVRSSTKKSQRFSDQKTFIQRLQEHVRGSLQVQQPDFIRLSCSREKQVNLLLQEFKKSTASDFRG